jgi:hypothetical protein
MARNGLLTYGKLYCELQRIILDTGASNGNYVGEKVLVRMGIPLTKCKNCSHEVRLGDGRTKILLDKQISLGVVFFKNEQVEAARVDALEFFVVNSLGDEAIIGIHALLGPLYDFFIDFLVDAHKIAHTNKLRRFHSHDWGPEYQEPEPYSLLDPWKNPPVVCPEDEATPIPTSFSDDVLFFMEVSVEESRRVYLDMVNNSDLVS